jgi:hypothetical protein
MKKDNMGLTNDHKPLQNQPFFTFEEGFYELFDSALINAPSIENPL